MDSGMTYNKMVERVLEDERVKQDFIVPPNDLRMINDSTLIYGDSSGLLKQTAHQNISQKLRIPAQFYNRMKEVPGLRSHVVTELLHNQEKPMFVRELRGNVRALLSDKYKTIDNSEILTAASPVLRDMDIMFRSANITDERMYLQFTFPRMEGEVAVGDVVQYGLTITNSEVGRGMVNVSPTIWRLVCSNGMIVRSEVRHRHVGKRMDGMEDYTVFSDETIVADQKAFRMKLQDTILATASEVKFDNIMAELRGAVGDKFDDPVKTMKNVTKRFSLSQDEEDLMLGNLFEDRDRSRWSVINAVTAMAHKTEDANKAFEYEKLGSEILVLNKSQWSVIAA